MAKRFTDTNKWRNEWFRTLSTQAKLTWVYLCDECEFHGVIKMDYGLASFQLGFQVTSQKLADWFGDKIHFISGEKILICPFFEFQYGGSKNTWSAKVRAKEKLEQLGFSIENNKLINPSQKNLTTVGTQSPDCDPTGLIRVIGIVNINNNKEDKKSFKKEIEDAYKLYPKKIGRSKGLGSLVAQIKTPGDMEALVQAIKRYRRHCEAEKRDPKYIMHFSTFANSWRDWSEDDAGTATLSKPDVVSEMKAKLDAYKKERATSL